MIYDTSINSPILTDLFRATKMNYYGIFTIFDCLYSSFHTVHFSTLKYNLTLKILKICTVIVFTRIFQIN